MKDLKDFNLKFENWALYLFDENRYRNISISKKALVDHFIHHHPSFKAIVDGGMVKKMLRRYADDKKLLFNPHKNGGRDWSNSVEYILIADHNFEKRKMVRTKTL